jgi:hypothetical protein
VGRKSSIEPETRNQKPGTLFTLFITRLSLLDMHKTEILHQRSVVMNQEASGMIAGVEMLVPAKNRNAENISVAPFVAPIFDETACQR